MIAVPAHYINQAYPALQCNHVAKENRKTQSPFLVRVLRLRASCRSVGAINILGRGQRLLACGAPVQSDGPVKQELTNVTYALAA